MLLERAKQVGPAYSLTRVLQLRRQKQIFSDAVLAVLHQEQIWEPHVPCPVRDTSSQTFRTCLATLLKASWDSTQIMTKDKEWASTVDEFLAFWNGDLTTDILKHYCNGCCKSEAECISKGMTVTRNMLFGKVERCAT